MISLENLTISFLFICSDAVGFSYCSENGLNFAAANAAYSEDDADFPSGRRNKPSRVSGQNVFPS